jgi:hypothetical protein
VHLVELPRPIWTDTVEDLRFASLLGREAWASLPEPVRRRFSKRLAGGAAAVYVGEVTGIWANPLGKTLAHAARLIGGPLPLAFDAPAASVVTVIEGGRGGQVWTRLYARRLKFPQVISSAKRFQGPTGLEEHVGRGVGMALVASVEAGVLCFRSAFYFVDIGRLRLRLPRWIEPGRITVTHEELGEGRFAFTLDIRHPLFGALLHQRAVFWEDAAQ